MKHCRKGRQFGRPSSQRKALISSLLVSLIIHESIETTEAKAKELKGKIDRIITKVRRAENNEMELVRKLEAILPKVAIDKLKNSFLNRMKDRNSGFTRVIKISPRKSDGASKAILEFVDFRSVNKNDLVENKQVSEE